MTPLDHLIAALVQLEEQAQEIEHKQSFIRSAIESFGVDADDALLVAVREDEPGVSVGVGIWPGKVIDVSPEVAEPDEDDHAASFRIPGTKQWNWELIGEEIEIGDIIGTRRTKHLQTVLGVSAATAQWMVKRCRELSLIDVERPSFDQQKARDAAAAAI